MTACFEFPNGVTEGLPEGMPIPQIGTTVFCSTSRRLANEENYIPDAVEFWKSIDGKVYEVVDVCHEFILAGKAYYRTFIKLKEAE